MLFEFFSVYFGYYWLISVNIGQYWLNTKRGDFVDEFMTLDELVTYLKVSKSTLYKLCERGMLPSCKVGRQLRFKKTEMDSWLRKLGKSKKKNYFGKKKRINE